MHIIMAVDCRQCRSVNLVLTNSEPELGKDHAVNCGLCGRRCVAWMLNGKGLTWYGSSDPQEWGEKLQAFVEDGVCAFSHEEIEARRQARRLVDGGTA